MRAVAMLVAVSIAAAAAEPAKLDRINLSNGRSLVGTIASETDGSYIIALAGGAGGSIQVAKSRVISVDRAVEDLPAPTVPVEEQQPIARTAPSSIASAAVERETTRRALRDDARKKGALVTKELFALVQPSMPKEEAFAILGPGFTVEPFDPRNPAGGVTYNWRNKNGSHVRVVLNRLNQVDRIDVMTPHTGRVELP